MRTQDANLWTALRVTAATLVLTGLFYPLCLTPLSQILFPGKAHGSQVQDDRGRVVGSALIGQRFVSPAYFHGRPSAAGSDGYDAHASGGSNWGPTSRKLRERVQGDVARLLQQNPEAPRVIPADLVTTSASGLDPHISLAAAQWQVPRIARTRGVAAARIYAVVQDQAIGRELGILGEPRVNVLMLNLALDRQFGRPGG